MGCPGGHKHILIRVPFGDIVVQGLERCVSDV